MEALSEAADAERKAAQHTLQDLETREAALQVEQNELRVRSASVLCQTAHFERCTCMPGSALTRKCNSRCHSLGRPLGPMTTRPCNTNLPPWYYADVQLRETELTEDLAQLRRDNDALVQPAITALVNQIAETKSEISRSASQAEHLTASKAELRARVETLMASVEASSATAGTLRGELTKVRAEPARMSKAVDSVQRALDSLNEEVTRLRNTIAAREQETIEQAAAVKEVEGVRKTLEANLARYRADIDAREQEVIALDRSLRRERAQHKDLLERRVELQAEDESVRASLRAALSEQESVNAAYERAKRELKRKQDALNDELLAAPPAQAALTDARLQLSRAEELGRDLELQLVAVKKEMDVLIAQYLREEGVEKRHREALQELAEACTSLDEEKEQWHREEALA